MHDSTLFNGTLRCPALILATLVLCVGLTGCRTTHRLTLSRPASPVAARASVPPGNSLSASVPQDSQSTVAPSTTELPDESMRSGFAQSYDPEVGSISPLDEAVLNENLPAPVDDSHFPDSLVDIPEIPAPEENKPAIMSTEDAVLLVESLDGSIRTNDQQQIIAVDLSFAKVTSDQLRALLWFDAIEQLDLTGSNVQDADLTVVCQLQSLQSVKLKGTAVSDDSVIQLSQLPDLQLLDLSKTSVTDRSLDRLVNAQKLRFLAVNSTELTDTAVVFLSRMKQLRGLSIIDTTISTEGIRQLRSTLPDCVIVDGAGAERLPEATQLRLALSAPSYEASMKQMQGAFSPSDSASAVMRPPGVHSSTGQTSQLTLMVQLAARRPDLAISLSSSYADNDQWHEVVEILQSAAMTEPRNEELQFRLGEALALSGRPRDAEQYLRVAAGDAAANYSMGLIAYEAMLKQCETYFERALVNDPAMQPAQARLNEIRQELASIRHHTGFDNALKQSPQIVPGAAPVQVVSDQRIYPEKASVPLPRQPIAASVNSAVQREPAGECATSDSIQLPTESMISIVPELKATPPIQLGGGVSAGAWKFIAR